MNRNFFVRLTFAAHRVADALPQEEQIAQEIRDGANSILSNLLLFIDKEVVAAGKKRDLLFQLERQIDILLVYLERAKEEGWVNPKNFSLLEEEYGNIQDLLRIFEEVSPSEGSSQESKVSTRKEKELIEEQVEVEKMEVVAPLSQRQRRIIEFLRAKENAQVWELQKVLPEVTKRTLRRDLDELLQKNLVERKGEWNSVSYELK